MVESLERHAFEVISIISAELPNPGAPVVEVVTGFFETVEVSLIHRSVFHLAAKACKRLTRRKLQHTSDSTLLWDSYLSARKCIEEIQTDLNNLKRVGIPLFPRPCSNSKVHSSPFD